MFLRKLFACLLPVLLSVGAMFLWPLLGTMEVWGCVLQGIMLGLLLLFCWLMTGSYRVRGEFLSLMMIPAGVLTVALCGQLAYYFGVVSWPLLQLIAATRGETLIIEACVSTFLWGILSSKK